MRCSSVSAHNPRARRHAQSQPISVFHRFVQGCQSTYGYQGRIAPKERSGYWSTLSAAWKQAETGGSMFSDHNESYS